MTAPLCARPGCGQPNNRRRSAVYCSRRCAHCNGEPPEGYSCMECGTSTARRLP